MGNPFLKFNKFARRSQSEETDNRKILECGCVYETEVNPQTGKSEEKIKLCPKHAEEQKEQIAKQTMSSASTNIIKHRRPEKI